MKDLNLSDALRFFNIGIYSIVLFYFTDSNFVRTLFSEIGVAGIVLLSFVVGSIVYLIYKPIFYNNLFIPLQDMLRKDRRNYRCRLRGRYNIRNSRQAMMFWLYLRNLIPPDKLVYPEKDASGNHFLYMAGLVSIFFSVPHFFNRDCIVGWLMVLIACVFLTAAILYDRFIEEYESNNLLYFTDKELDRLATKFGLKPRTKEGGQNC